MTKNPKATATATPKSRRKPKFGKAEAALIAPTPEASTQESAPSISSHYMGAAAGAQNGPSPVRIDPVVSEAAQHLAFEGLFSMLTARSNAHNKSPVCYQKLSDGSYLVCMIQNDGSYGQCKAYSGPVPGPICG